VFLSFHRVFVFSSRESERASERACCVSWFLRAWETETLQIDFDNTDHVLFSVLVVIVFCVLSFIGVFSAVSWPPEGQRETETHTHIHTIRIDFDSECNFSSGCGLIGFQLLF
jgi:hypothetical protein